MPGHVWTKRWCDPAEPGDGTRILVCRYRPRALKKAGETWHTWARHLGPSPGLHAALYGKAGPVPGWDEFARRYVAEMAGQGEVIGGLAARVRAGETITLLCSKACDEPARCHRTLLKQLIEDRVRSAEDYPGDPPAQPPDPGQPADDGHRQEPRPGRGRGDQPQ